MQPVDADLCMAGSSCDGYRDFSSAACWSCLACNGSRGQEAREEEERRGKRSGMVIMDMQWLPCCCVQQCGHQHKLKMQEPGLDVSGLAGPGRHQLLCENVTFSVTDVFITAGGLHHRLFYQEGCMRPSCRKLPVPNGPVTSGRQTPYSGVSRAMQHCRDHISSSIYGTINSKSNE